MEEPHLLFSMAVVDRSLWVYPTSVILVGIIGNLTWHAPVNLLRYAGNELE